MRSSTWVWLPCALLLACGGEETDAFAYGPCGNEGCGDGALHVSSEGTCICVRLCHLEDECPQPMTGDVQAVCIDLGDVVNNGYEGQCDLPCSAEQTCPDASACIDGFCRYRSDF